MSSKLWGFEDGETFCAAAQFHEMPQEYLMQPCAHVGDSDAAMHEAIIDIHRFARVQYAANIRKVGRNVYPLIIARDNVPELDPDDMGRQGLGGIYTLYLENGDVRTIRPTPPAYERLKCLSHIPLGLFNVLSPYFHDRNAKGWRGNVEQFVAKIAEAQRRVKGSFLDERESEITGKILDRSVRYVAHLMSFSEATPEGFEAYTKSIRPAIRDAMDFAAQLQMDASLAALNVWKEELGPALWRDLHVVVTTIWPVSEHNPRWQLFCTLMDADRVDTHLIVGEGVKTQEEARDLLGRIVADRLASRMIVGIDDERGRRMTQCLSSRTDVVADAAYNALKRHFPEENLKKQA